MRTNKVYDRRLPWQGMGTTVNEAATSAEAIRLAGLDWEVIQRPIFCDGMVAPGILGNVRVEKDPDTGEMEKSLLGIVSQHYKPVQNREAFDFFDSLIGTEARYDTAGCLQGGRRIFLAAKMERDWMVGDDDINSYLLLSNGHDGGHALRAAITPIRVICLNTLILALKEAKQSWSIRHIGGIDEKVKEAQIALGLTAAYMDEFVEFGNRATDTKVSANLLESLADELFKPADSSEQAKKNAERRKSLFERCLYAPDLTAYQGTKWGVLNAVSDFETHYVRKQSAVIGKVLNNRLPLFSRASAFLAQAS